jgi:hypothetical protein
LEIKIAQKLSELRQRNAQAQAEAAAAAMSGLDGHASAGSGDAKDNS